MMEKYMYINESFANVKKTKKQLHLKGTQYCSCYICCHYADHSCLVSSGGILDEDSCHGSHDMVCDDRFGNFMTDEPNFPP
jgi:hypothetical protein